MDPHSALRRQLSHLEHIATSKLHTDKPVRVGFNQKKKNTQPSNPPRPSQLEHLLRAEQSLLADLKEIDRTLQKQHDHFAYHHGFLFDQGLLHDLPFKLAALVSSNVDALEHGFSLWRVTEEEGTVRIISGKIANSPPGFGKQLTEKSLEKLVEYYQKKNEESIKQTPKPWEYFSRSPKHLRLKTEGPYERRKGQGKLEPLSNSRLQADNRRRYTDNASSILDSRLNISQLETNLLTSTPHSQKVCFNQLSPQPSPQELQKMLLKENRIVSLWTPPSSYPQLLAVLSIQIREKDVKLKSCWLRKYYISRHALTRRLAEGLLDWASRQFGLVEELVTTASKEAYEAIFSGQGWKISSWIRDDRLRIYYRRTLLI